MFTMKLRLIFPPSKTAEASTIINSVAGPTFADPDCVSFRFYREVANDDSLILWQEWETREALEQHIRSKDFMKILTVMDLATQEPEVRIQTLSNRKGFEFIEELRS
ncbi:MAG: antibiotic biosynthesis monooxygenase [Deltaproteobacteria bacterium]|nr:antibiotic biosynthesis monooxygenase [Deltaproteobacteria bacterium]